LRWFSDDTADGVDAEPRVAGDDVWYIRKETTVCQDTIWRVNRREPVDATKVVTADGHMSTLAVSADGTRLAWTLSPCASGEPVLHVLDRTTGDGRTIVMGAPPVVSGPPSWSPDDQHLALMARGGGGVAYGVNVIDAATATDIGLEPSLRGSYCYQERPQFLADGTVVVLTCPQGNTEAVFAMRFDAQGNQLGKLFDVTGNFDTSFYVDQVTSFSLTPDGKHAIYQVQPSRGPVTTYRWDGGAVRRLNTEATDVAW
jgi:Tol biopolymer transport system component